jgi:hypothetical protein
MTDNEPGYKERAELIKAIEKKLDSPLVTYVTSDRVNLPQLMIADDAIAPIHDHLSNIGRRGRVNLFLYTRGGVMMSSFRIVKLIREFCDSFHVLVPFRAHSGGTQICLGADGLVLTRMSELGPVDPSVTNDFNPVDKLNPKRRVPISVEDVDAFLDLAKEKGGLVSENSKLEVFKILTSQVDAMALGNVNRVYAQVRFLVDKLLTLHLDKDKEAAKIEKIKKALTEEYTHDYTITRDEAKLIGLPVAAPDSSLEDLILKLHKCYSDALKLEIPFNPDAILGTTASSDVDLRMGFIESSVKSYVYVYAANLSRPTVQPVPTQIQGVPAPVLVSPQPMSMPVTVRIKGGGWMNLIGAPTGA